LRVGFVKASFIPPKIVRHWRELTRYRRSLVEALGDVKRQVHKLLESSNIKIDSVVSVLFGKTGRNLMDLLAKDQLTAHDLNNGPDEEPSHTALAEAIASGRADVGLGLESAARARGLDFEPLVQEQFHLVCLKSALDTPATLALRHLLQESVWRDTLNTLPGYQAQDSGQVQSLSEQLPWWTFQRAKKTS